MEIYQDLIHPKAFMMAAGKIDKISGDIRVCFEILRSAIQNKLDQLSISSLATNIQVGYDDVNNVILEMYESKVVKIVRKLPRSHIVLLSELCNYMRSKSGFALNDLWLSETELLNMYNRRANQLLIDKIAAGELSDIVQTLTNSDILLLQNSKAYKSRAKNLKAFKVSFKCELAEIEEALVQSNYSDKIL